MQNLPFGVSLLLGNRMFEINAREISDAICVNSTFRERTEGDVWRTVELDIGQSTDGLE